MGVHDISNLLRDTSTLNDQSLEVASHIRCPELFQYVIHQGAVIHVRRKAAKDVLLRNSEYKHKSKHRSSLAICFGFHTVTFTISNVLSPLALLL
jgi:hypothetical protein